MPNINTTPNQLTLTATQRDCTSVFATRSWTDTKRHSNALDYYTIAINPVTRAVRCTCRDAVNKRIRATAPVTIETPIAFCKHIRAGLDELSIEPELATIEAPRCECGEAYGFCECGLEDEAAAVPAPTPPLAPSTGAAKSFMQKFGGKRIQSRDQYREAVSYGKAMTEATR